MTTGSHKSISTHFVSESVWSGSVDNLWRLLGRFQGGSMSGRPVVLGVVLTLFATFVPGAAFVHAQRGAQKGDWRAYGGDKGGTKYSPLDQIDRDNFAV